MNKWLNSTVDTYIKHYGKATNPIIYEVGSRDGKDGYELAQRISDAYKDEDLVLFECNPPHIEQIKQNYPNATLITTAVSDKAGEVEFLQIQGDKDYMGSSSMDLNRKNYSWVKDTNTIKVKTRRLDDVIEELAHEEIDIMKIDIEGYTYEALCSLGEYLRMVKVFHLETEIKGVARDKTNVDIALMMQEKGYKLVAVENEWGDNIEDHVYVKDIQSLPKFAKGGVVDSTRFMDILDSQRGDFIAPRSKWRV